MYMKHKNSELLDKMADEMAGKLKTVLGTRVLGPDKPPVARIQTLYIKKLVVKIENDVSMNKVREILYDARLAMLQNELFKSAIIYYDVDPM